MDPNLNNFYNLLFDIKDVFISSLNQYGGVIENSDESHHIGFENITWGSDIFKKAHVNIIDLIDVKGIWMMHCCIYPNSNNSAPIFGFDIFAGKSKITGCFHDFSPVIPNHPLSSWFSQESKQLSWNKKRQLPDWALPIFSDDIIAVGNVQNINEIEQILSVISKNIHTYLSYLKTNSETFDDITNKHIFYISQQRLNPHNPKILENIGLTSEEALHYINNILFPDD